MLIVLGWILVPVYAKNKINTLPEYFEKRFNRTFKFSLSSIYVLCNIFIRLMIILIAGRIIISAISSIDPYSFLLFFLIITGIYIITGGLRAEIYVNIILLVFIILGTIGFSGWIIYQGEAANLSFYNLSSFSSFSTDSNYTLPGLIFGLLIIGFWFWCADQFTVQKVLSTRNISYAKKSVLFSGFLQLIPVLIFVLISVIIVTFSQDTTFRKLHSLFSQGILPETIKATIIIALSAGLMSSFASVFNSTTTLITFDFYRSFRPQASGRKLVLVGRLTTLSLLFFSILLIPLSQNIDFNLGLVLFKIFCYFSAMIAAIFLVSLINPKINSVSALTTLVTGTIMILLRSIVEISGNPSFEGNLINWFIKSGFFEFSIITFLFSLLFIHVFSRLKWAQDEVNLLLNTLKRGLLKLKSSQSSYMKVFILLSVLIIIFLWWTFL